MKYPLIVAPLFAAAALTCTTAVVAAPASAPMAATAVVAAEGVVQLRSASGFDQTVAQLKADVAAKGIRFFDAIDQAALAEGAGLKVRRSTLVLFGNPPLGVQFLQSNPYAGLDWPVRMLVLEDADGRVWVAWTDFGFIARRYRITDRPAQFKMASEVAASIASAATR
ncbi:MAG: DUF302 domain-containing protein [Sphingomonas sp.]|jgi:uncharacterized protein (DUF302 family)|uniref:DUF302 domain-containing protein n=1 Tax=Sphingomonas sp. TaxID=28214 RepID=UPI003564A895